MSEQKYSSLEEYFDDIARKTIEKCTLCGECLRNCPTFPLTPIKDKAPEEIIEKMINFLKGGGFSEEVYHKVFSCSSCGICSDSCPEGIDVLLAYEAAKIGLAKRGKVPEPVNFVGEIPGFWRTLSALQTKPSEARWLKKASSRPERTENVVFLGCTPPAFPDKAFAFLDVLERIGINFITLAGGELCCGFPFFPAAGKVRESEEKARELVSNLKAFSPKRVILLCAGCYHQFTRFYTRFLELDFEVQYYAQFLNENVEKINFTKPLGKTVILHESCMSGRAKVNETSTKLLESIPGLKVVKAQTICCGGTPKLTSPQITQNLAPTYVETLAEETKKAGSDYLVNICQLCRMTFYPSIKKYSFGLKDIPGLINESMGGREYEDKWETYSKYEGVDEIIEKSRDNFEENGFTEEEVRQVLPLFFPFSVP